MIHCAHDVDATCAHLQAVRAFAKECKLMIDLPPHRNVLAVEQARC
jgi:hypothetical protein